MIRDELIWRKEVKSFVFRAALIGFSLLCNCSAAQRQLLTDEQLRDGWIQLFDGETLFGWEATSDADWKVVDGAIGVTAGKPGFLMTTSQFADYELHVEFKAPATTNSGIFLRTPITPTDPTKDCIEVNIAPNDNAFPTPSLVGRLKTPISEGGSIRETGEKGYRRVVSQEMPDPWDGQWHALDVFLSGAACEVALDGVIMSAYFSEERNYGSLGDVFVSCGRIGLQFREGPVAFRNIRTKPLNTKPIFDGENLDGWNTNLAKASKFDVTEAGELQVTNGSGQLESNDRFGNFILQLECITNGDNLNSGVFFRCIPGELMNGYECQIHNGMKDNDPTKPADFGTGAIYRRVPARRVMSRDHKWFAMTLLADGPHIATWVNGVQVVDWTDTRDPHENPRNGLRLEPGTFCIQGHDPTTNLLFRGLRVVELPGEN